MRPIVKTVGLICILFDCPDKNVIVDPAAELHRMEEVQNARQEMNRTKDEAV